MPKPIAAIPRKPIRKTYTKAERRIFGPDIFDTELGVPYLFPGENRTDFNSLRARIFSSSRPEDAIEALSCREVSILIWEVGRYHRIKASKINSAIVKVLTELIRSERSDDFDDLYQKLPGLVVGGEFRSLKLTKLLEKKSVTYDDVLARSYFDAKNDIQKCDDKIEKLYNQIDKLLSDLDRRRDAFKRRLEWTSRNIEHELLTDDQRDYVDASEKGPLFEISDLEDTTPKKRKSSARSQIKSENEPALPGFEEHS